MKKNKMFVFKKNTVVTMALISILVVAGYLNYSGGNLPDDDETSTVSAPMQEEKGEETDPEPEKYGEVRFVSATPGKDETKLRAEKERSMAIEIYKEISESDSANEEQKKSAAEKMKKTADAMVSEANIEAALSGKGFDSPSVTVGEENVYISVKDDTLSTDKLALIQNTVIEETGIHTDKIRISLRK